MSQTYKPKATSNSPTEAGQSSLLLQVQGLGHTPSFKNGKRLFLTSKKNAQWMKACTASFVSQCISKCQTAGGAISTEDLRRFLTASLPLDDNWLNVPILIVTSEEVEPGEEGATVEIAPLD